MMIMMIHRLTIAMVTLSCSRLPYITTNVVEARNQRTIPSLHNYQKIRIRKKHNKVVVNQQKGTIKHQQQRQVQQMHEDGYYKFTDESFDDLIFSSGGTSSKGKNSMWSKKKIGSTTSNKGSSSSTTSNKGLSSSLTAKTSSKGSLSYYHQTSFPTIPPSRTPTTDSTTSIPTISYEPTIQPTAESEITKSNRPSSITLPSVPTTTPTPSSATIIDFPTFTPIPTITPMPTTTGVSLLPSTMSSSPTVSPQPSFTSNPTILTFEIGWDEHGLEESTCMIEPPSHSGTKRRQTLAFVYNAYLAESSSTNSNSNNSGKNAAAEDAVRVLEIRLQKAIAMDFLLCLFDTMDTDTMSMFDVTKVSSSPLDSIDYAMVCDNDNEQANTMDNPLLEGSTCIVINAALTLDVFFASSDNRRQRNRYRRHHRRMEQQGNHSFASSTTDTMQDSSRNFHRWIEQQQRQERVYNTQASPDVLNVFEKYLKSTMANGNYNDKDIIQLSFQGFINVNMNPMIESTIGNDQTEEEKDVIVGNNVQDNDEQLSSSGSIKSNMAIGSSVVAIAAIFLILVVVVSARVRNSRLNSYLQHWEEEPNAFSIDDYDNNGNNEECTNNNNYDNGHDDGYGYYPHRYQISPLSSADGIVEQSTTAVIIDDQHQAPIEFISDNLANHSSTNYKDDNNNLTNNMEDYNRTDDYDDDIMAHDYHQDDNKEYVIIESKAEVVPSSTPRINDESPSYQPDVHQCISASCPTCRQHNSNLPTFVPLSSKTTTKTASEAIGDNGQDEEVAGIAKVFYGQKQNLKPNSNDDNHHDERTYETNDTVDL